jgi:hypothetical protein
VNALKRALAAASGWLRIQAPTCCPHLELDDPDTAYLPADTTRHDYRGSATNG